MKRCGFSLWILMGACSAALAGPPPGGYLDEAKYPNIIAPDLQVGFYGDGAGKMANPSGAAVAGGRLYVTECGNDRIQVFDLSGKMVDMWGSRGAESGKLRCPSGVAVSSDGHVYVSDAGNHRIQVFGTDGAHIQTFGAWGRGTAEFMEPQHLTIDGTHLYVADTGNNRVSVFERSPETGKIGTSHAFSIIQAAEGNDRFRSPTAVAVDEHGNIYVADSLNNRIVKFNVTGNYLKAWGTYGSHNLEFAEPTGLAYFNGQIFVADLVNHRVQVTDTEGLFLRQWGRHPPNEHEGHGRIHYPMHIAAADEGVVICEPFEHRCQLFGHKVISKVTNVNDSAWWDKGMRFHYGAKPSAGMGMLAISEPDTHHVLVYDISNLRSKGNPRLIESFGGFGKAINQFSVPTGVAIDPKTSRIYVSDKGNQRVQVFRVVKNEEVIGETGGKTVLTGKTRIASVSIDFEREIGARDERGGAKASTAAGEFNEPGHLTVDGDGLLWVIDNLSRIQVFGAGGQPYLATIGGFGTEPGKFNGPLGLAFSPDSQHLYVVDAYNYRVQKFKITRGADATGNRSVTAEFVKMIGGPGPRRPLLEPRRGEFVFPFGIAVAPDGKVFVSDKAANVIQAFDADLNYIREWGSFGTGAGQFYDPKGLAVDEAGNVIIMNFGNHRADVFTEEGVYLKSFGIGEMQQFDPVAAKRP
jgi:tripartite motif-containing protein 71